MKRTPADERIAKIRARAAEEEAKVIKDEALLSSIPEWALEYNHNSPFWHRLYGHEVSINWKANQYYSLGGGTAPDIDFAARLMAEYPPVPLNLVEDGCKSFRESYAAGSRGTITLIAPFIVRIGGHDRTAGIEWTSEIAGFHVQLRVSIPIPQWLGVLSIETRTVARRFTIIERCEFNAVANGARVIKWARAGDEYPNDFTVYWLDPAYTLADLLAESAK